LREVEAEGATAKRRVRARLSRQARNDGDRAALLMSPEFTADFDAHAEPAWRARLPRPPPRRQRGSGAAAACGKARGVGRYTT